MRLAPKSLAGQLTLLLLLALAVAQGVAVALFAWERIEALRHAHRDNALARTATVARLLGDTPPGLHDSVIAAASTELARFSLTGEPVVVETGAGEQAAAIARDLSAALGVAPERVRVAPLRTRYLDDDDGRDDDDDDHHDHEMGRPGVGLAGHGAAVRGGGRCTRTPDRGPPRTRVRAARPAGARGPARDIPDPRRRGDFPVVRYRHVGGGSWSGGGEAHASPTTATR